MNNHRDFPRLISLTLHRSELGEDVQAFPETLADWQWQHQPTFCGGGGGNNGFWGWGGGDRGKTVKKLPNIAEFCYFFPGWKGVKCRLEPLSTPPPAMPLNVATASWWISLKEYSVIVTSCYDKKIMY